MEFEDAENRKKLDPIIAAFENFCVDAVNVTYERYVFNCRAQESGERFETFLGEVRRLARSCEFGAVVESMIRAWAAPAFCDWGGAVWGQRLGHRGAG